MLEDFLPIPELRKECFEFLPIRVCQLRRGKAQRIESSLGRKAVGAKQVDIEKCHI